MSAQPAPQCLFTIEEYLEREETALKCSLTMTEIYANFDEI